MENIRIRDKYPGSATLHLRTARVRFFGVPMKATFRSAVVLTTATLRPIASMTAEVRSSVAITATVRSVSAIAAMVRLSGAASAMVLMTATVRLARMKATT